MVSTMGNAYRNRGTSMSHQDHKDTQNKISLMRGHHFHFGNTNPVMMSTAKEKFIDFSKQGERAILAQDKKDDLRKHHFELGGVSAPAMTSNNMDYGPKAASP